MGKWKKILHKLLFPGTAITLLSIPVSAALLIYTFVYGQEDSPAAYLSYLISAYATILVCVQIPRFIKSGSALMHRDPYLHRYLTDLSFRMQVSLYLTFGFNLFYAVLKFFLGIYYRSVWFGTFGVYYTLLTTMRFLLLRHINRNAFGAELIPELRRYRLCGIILIPMTIALAGVVILMVNKGEGFQYPGYLIYVVALYAFYAVIAAAVNLIKYKTYPSPVMRAAKAVSLASALVSILSLETAMLSQFGEESGRAFQQIMTAATGACVCTGIFGMAVFMIVHATKKLKQLQTNG